MAYYHLIKKETEIDKIHFPTLERTKLFLNEILTDLVKFTNENKLSIWEKTFQEAIDYLNYNKPDELLQKDYLPEKCFGLEAKQILAACDKAWVFGGMGSWNDVVRVSNYDLYRRLTSNLYDTISKSIVSAINSYPE